MNNPAKNKQLTELLEASRLMLECANNGDWDVVEKLQLRGQQMSNELFSEPVAVNEVAVFSGVIREVLAINESIMTLGASAREICMKNVGLQKHNRKALKEYTANAG